MAEEAPHLQAGRESAGRTRSPSPVGGVDPPAPLRPVSGGRLLAARVEVGASFLAEAETLFGRLKALHAALLPGAARRLQIGGQRLECRWRALRCAAFVLPRSPEPWRSLIEYAAPARAAGVGILLAAGSLPASPVERKRLFAACAVTGIEEFFPAGGAGAVRWCEAHPARPQVLCGGDSRGARAAMALSAIPARPARDRADSLVAVLGDGSTQGRRAGEELGRFLDRGWGMGIVLCPDGGWLAQVRAGLAGFLEGLPRGRRGAARRRAARGLRFVEPPSFRRAVALVEELAPERTLLFAKRPSRSARALAALPVLQIGAGGLDTPAPADGPTAFDFLGRHFVLRPPAGGADRGNDEPPGSAAEMP